MQQESHELRLLRKGSEKYYLRLRLDCTVHVMEMAKNKTTACSMTINLETQPTKRTRKLMFSSDARELSG